MVRSPRFWSQNPNPTNEHRCPPTWLFITLRSCTLNSTNNLENHCGSTVSTTICCCVSSASRVGLGLGPVEAHTQWRPCTDSRLYEACFCSSYCTGLQCGSYYRPLHHLPPASRACSSRVRMLAQLAGIAVQPLPA